MVTLDPLYAVVIFLSALLLFLVEPMTAKRLLPLLGGSSAVWIACLVFFQTALLAGYVYAHLTATRVRPRSQAVIHTVLLVLATIGLGFPINPDPGGASWHPLATTIWLLTVLIGLPFVALAATTPLLQSWQAQTGPQSPKSPAWRLYALSNLGSLLALVLYPWLIEPRFALATQRLAWAAGFGVFALACGGLAWRQVGRQVANPVPPDPVAGASAGRRLLWVLLPAASSMLLCAITAHLGQNIAAIPLLWIVPLSAYLVSFVVTFAGERWYRRPLATKSLALALATIGYLLQNQSHTQPLLISLPIYVGALFVFCYFCHGECIDCAPQPGSRPPFICCFRSDRPWGPSLLAL